MNENEITNIARDVARQVYQEYGNRFGVNQTPRHTHNGIDSPHLEPGSVNAFIPLPAQPADVIGMAIANGQPIGQAFPQVNVNQPQLFSPSLPYITGHGVGDASAFNGGDAPDGSVLLFSNGNNISQLWWHVGGNWRGINVDSLGNVSGLIV